MKVSEIGNSILDRWVAQAEDIEVRYSNAGEFWRIMGEIDEVQWLPHRDWAQAGPIIEREKIAVFPNGGNWHAVLDSAPELKQSGATPLIAAMRCYVAYKFGTELPDKP
jgi:hypothetical protein